MEPLRCIYFRFLRDMEWGSSVVEDVSKILGHDDWPSFPIRKTPYRVHTKYTSTNLYEHLQNKQWLFNKKV
jgi:hypothetical protein